MENATSLSSSGGPSSGPQELTTLELGRFGLGVVVRHLPSPGVASAPTLNRVYCLSCGIAIDHEVRGSEWWLCGNSCNERHEPEPVRHFEDPLRADVRRLRRDAANLWSARTSPAS